MPQFRSEKLILLSDDLEISLICSGEGQRVDATAIDCICWLHCSGSVPGWMHCCDAILCHVIYQEAKPPLVTLVVCCCCNSQSATRYLLSGISCNAGISENSTNSQGSHMACLFCFFRVSYPEGNLYRDP